MLIRPALVEDAAGIAGVHVAGWRAGYRGLLPDALLAGLDVDRYRAGWTRLLSAPDPRSTTLVAERDGVVGFVQTTPARDDDADPATTAELTTLYVHPDAWGTGAGRALTTAVLTAAATQGFTDVTLWVLHDNGRARRFYETGGWVPDGRTKHDTQGGAVLSEVRYRRALTVGTPGSP
ncbi:GNAT family N-acetyltransferase [Goekera deserti]|uniref:GNAT family N-acetyltransferase n=1 Tax=Goekera deserti TaxID=2497753 RepID=A0A7K3WFG0_9ACTN|nr:GNAT family N-acetyltransferase [Goekera deserti]NDI46664.1 GNAT family N-acetyltransferase [Goekera deserti]NEL54233.1 GNAT family N-acetyltransferase [Goekera deserti]